MATAKIVEDHSKYIENLNEIETKKLESDALAQELQAKVADLEKQLSEKQDRVLYWYNEHNKLQEKLNALASNAAQVNAVKPNAEAEKT
jgi:Tfp pilus assembly protein FimV